MRDPSFRSGGQKQRVSLARAVYHKSDIVLMDDPLSAVDQNVGRHIFDQCIRGFLSDRTVIIVTHQLQYLHRCDKVVMLQSGKIAYQGTYNELMANEPSFNTLINTHVMNEDDDTIIDEGQPGEEGPIPTSVDQSTVGLDSSEGSTSGLSASDKKMLERLGAGPRRHTLPPGTKVGDMPGTATIVNQNYDTITPKERLQLLQRQLPHIHRDSILANTLQEHTNIHFINHANYGFNSPVGDSFSRAVQRNELTIYSIPEGNIYGYRHGKHKHRKVKHRYSVTGVSMRKSSVPTINPGYDDGDTHHHRHSTMTHGDDDSDYSSSDDEDYTHEEGDGVLIGEDKSMDELGIADYVKYFRSGSGVLITFLVIALFFVAHGIRIGSDYWLRLWVPNTLNASDSLYLGVYGAFIAAFACGVLLRGLWFAKEATRKSKELHDRAFQVPKSCSTRCGCVFD